MEHKLRYARIERDETVSVHEDENAHLWAVSYSDFLMVLLCFFVLFFSLDEKKQNILLINLAENLNGLPGQGTGTQLHSPERKIAQLPATFLETLQNLNISVNKDKESLIINFPENLFKSGSHLANKDNTHLINEVLGKIYPHKDAVNLYFEGHTDNKPIERHLQNVVVDNYLLSSLRASTALHLAKNMGFPEMQMYIQATSFNLRNSRTLSIRVEPREVLR